MSDFFVRRALFGRKLAIAAALAGVATWLFWKLGKAPGARKRPR